MGLKGLWQKWRLYRKAKPIIDHLEKEETMDKLKSRSFWLTTGLLVVGVVLQQLGVAPEKWQSFMDSVTPMLLGWFGLNATEHVKNAIVAKKNGG